MNPIDLVNLSPLMELTRGRPEIVVGLLDGPVAMNHPDLMSGSLQELPGNVPQTCLQSSSIACLHGTFVAGILCAKRGSVAPAICPNCTLLVRPVFAETTSNNGQTPSATPEELAVAIMECVNAGARLLNLSLGLVQASSTSWRRLEEALDHAARSGVIIVAAAGNQGAVGASTITRHPWVIPVVAYDLRGRPTPQSNLGRSIGRHGLGAPGDNTTSLGADGKPLTFAGTSVATPFVTGAIALLWSEFPTATPAEMKFAVTNSSRQRRTSVVPPMLDAWAAYQVMGITHARR